jgi:hypothetical protein
LNKTQLNDYKNILETFLLDYQTYIGSYYVYDEIYTNDNLRTQMQRQLVLVSRIVSLVHGGCSLKINKDTTLDFHQALSNVLTSNVSKDSKQRHFIEFSVESTLNEAVGNIVNGTIPTQTVKPIIPIKDEILRKRCADLLNAPGSFDRVINQATQVLEDRLRTKLPFEQFCEVIPETKNQIGENLAHRLLAPPNPRIMVSDNLDECSAFHKIVVGIISYLRNPSHHTLNHDTEWSLAWSVVGIIDSLLSEIDNSYITSEETKPVLKKNNK